MIYATNALNNRIQPHGRYSQSSPKRILNSNSDLHTKTIFKANPQPPEQSDIDDKNHLQSRRQSTGGWSSNSDWLQMQLQLERSQKEVEFYRKTIQSLTHLISNSHHSKNQTVLSSYIGSFSSNSEDNTRGSFISPKNINVLHRQQVQINKLKTNPQDIKTARSHVLLSSKSLTKKFDKNMLKSKEKQNRQKSKIEIYEKKIRELDRLIKKLFQYISQNTIIDKHQDAQSQNEQNRMLSPKNERVAQLERQNDLLRKQLQYQTQMKQKLQKEVSDQLAVLEKYKETVQKAESRISQIQAMYNNILLHRDMVDQQNTFLKAQNLKYQGQLTQCNHQRDKHKQCQKSYQMKMEDFKELIAEAEFSRERMLAQADRDREQLQGEVAKLRQVNEAMERELSMREDIICKLQEQFRKISNSN